MNMLLTLAIVAVSASDPNPVYDDLVNKGVRVDGMAEPVKLPPPLLTPGADAKTVDAILEEAAGKYPLELFVKNFVNAPHNLKIDSVEDASGTRRAQLLRLTFVAYGTRDALAKADVLSLLGGGKKKNPDGPTPLPLDELKARGITPLTAKGLEEAYVPLDVNLIDAIKITGATRNVQTQGADEWTVAVRMDDRFAKDPAYPNQWQSVGRGAHAGELSPPKPYGGLAGYVRVATLAGKQDAVLVEMRFLLPEPPEWFGGPNQLRSKLPLAVSDNVQSYRRMLTKN